jgi:uncharacterized membrane-anchored protein
MQLTSLRSNQTFTVDYGSGKLIPQIELILLVEKPKYSQKGDKIIKGSEIQELRFTTGTNGIKQIIGMLEQAVKISDDYEKLAGLVNQTVSK